MRLTIVDRYILREVAQTWVAVTAVLFLILATNSLIHLLGKVVEGQVSGTAVLPFFLVQLTIYFVTLIPLGMFLSLLLAFGRLYADSEMAALGACGLGLARLFRPVALIGLAGALLTAALTFWASPWAERASDEIAARLAAQSRLAGIAPGRFNEVGNGIVLFAGQRGDEGTLHDLFVVAPGQEGGQVIVRARSAQVRSDDETGRRYLEFGHGERFTDTPGSDHVRTITFDWHGIHLPRRGVQASSDDPEDLSMTALLADGGAEAIAEFQWRVSLPLACLLLALAALPLSRTTPRKGRYGKIAIALVLYLGYSNLLVFARDMVADGQVPVIPGMWWAHVLVGLLVGAMVVHQAGWRWTRSLVFERARPGDVR